METVLSCEFLLSRKVRKFKSTSLVWLLCNKLLSNFACSSHAGEYWPLLVLVQTLLCSVWTAMIMAVQTERCGPHAQLGRSYFFCFELAVLVFMAISVESFQWWLQGGCSRFEVDWWLMMFWCSCDCKFIK